MYACVCVCTGVYIHAHVRFVICENHMRSKNPKSLQVVQALSVCVCVCMCVCVYVCVCVAWACLCKDAVGRCVAGNNASA